MSRFQISELSFCETELHSNSQVQGGANVSLGISKGLNVNNADQIRLGVSWSDDQTSPEVSLSATPDYTITRASDENTTQYQVSNKLGETVASLGFSRLNNGGKIVLNFTNSNI